MLIKKIFSSIKKNGYILTIKKIFFKALSMPLVLLRVYFQYNSWHDSLFIQRRYAQKIVSHLNKRMVRNSVLEIGCGTGDILRRLNYANKTGLDYEQGALNALNFLSYLKNVGGYISIKKFDFLSDEVNGKYDVIILCNWIHEIEPSVLKFKISQIFKNNLNDNGEIILDVLENLEYKYNHSIIDLIQNLNCKKVSLGEFESGRVIFCLMKTYG